MFWKSKKKQRIMLEGDHSNYHCGSAAAFNVIRDEAARNGQLVGKKDEYDLLIINGEGSMHHSSRGLWKKLEQIEKALEKGKRVMLVNTVWQENPQEAADILSKCESVVVREILSQQELKSQGVNSRVCLDQSFHDEIDESAPFHDYEGAVVFTDFWSTEFEGFVRPTSKWAQKFPYLDMQEMSWSSTVKSLRTASLLVTGRHHAVYAACKAETPFIAMTGNTHKIEGLIATSGIELPVLSNFIDIKKLVSEGHIPKNECMRLFEWMKKQPQWSVEKK